MVVPRDTELPPALPAAWVEIIYFLNKLFLWIELGVFPREFVNFSFWGGFFCSKVKVVNKNSKVIGEYEPEPTFYNYVNSKRYSEFD